jgi:O-antigen/teichoic acid export membrane protein
VSGSAEGTVLGSGMDDASRSIRKGRWLRFYALLVDERVLVHNLIVAGGTMLAGVLGIVFQALMSHQLRPIEFGGVFVVVTLITVVGLPASAFTLLMARETSRDQALGNYASRTSLLHGGDRALLLVGGALAAIMALGSHLIAAFLNVGVDLVLAAAVGLPFTLALPLLLGVFQGEQRFVAFSILLAAQAGLKLIAAVLLGAVFGAVGVIAAISLIAATVYLIARRMLHREFSRRERRQWLRPTASYLLVILPSTLSLAALLSSDVFLVKHYFSTQVAGEYAAVAALGRAIFWGATGVATVLFPKVIFRGSRGQSGRHIVSGSLLLVAAGGVSASVLLAVGSGWVLMAFAGTGYADAASYLPWYALAMLFLGGAAVLIATHQSNGGPGFLAVLLPLSLVEPILLVAVHKTVGQVVQVVDLLFALVFIGLAVLYLAQERARASALILTPITPPAIRELGVKR